MVQESSGNAEKKAPMPLHSATFRTYEGLQRLMDLGNHLLQEIDYAQQALSFVKPGQEPDCITLEEGGETQQL